MRKIEMNDCCAAGTEKYLESAVITIGYIIEEFGRKGLLAEKDD